MLSNKTIFLTKEDELVLTFKDGELFLIVNNKEKIKPSRIKLEAFNLNEQQCLCVSAFESAVL